MKLITKPREHTAPVRYGAVSYWLTVACAVLLTAVVIAAGVLGLMVRADAQIALGNAKAVRMALHTVSIERYGAGLPFADPSQAGGVPAEVYREVLRLSKAPGDLWLLQTGEDGYDVAKLIYTEGAFTVTYTADPASWVVDGQIELIHAVP